VPVLNTVIYNLLHNFLQQNPFIHGHVLKNGLLVRQFRVFTAFVDSLQQKTT